MYDARDRNAGMGGTGKFALIAVGVVASVFMVTLKGPDMFGGQASPHLATAGQTAPKQAALAARLTSPDERRVLAALQKLSPKAVSALETDTAQGLADRDRRAEAVNQAAGQAIAENIDVLAQMRVSDLDRLATRLTADLKRARQSGSRLCQGATYARLEGQSPGQIEAWLRAQGFTQARFYDTAMGYNALFLEAVARARHDPARHGKLTGEDEAALQGLMMSLMSDPALMQAAMAPQGSGRADAARRINVCELGLAMLQGVRTLPEGTKGRAWAAMFERAEVRRAMQQAANF